MVAFLHMENNMYKMCNWRLLKKDKWLLHVRRETDISEQGP